MRANLDRRLEAVELQLGATDDAEIDAFWDAIPDYTLSRFVAYCEAVKADPMPEAGGWKRRAEDMTGSELRRACVASIKQFIEAERPFVEAVEKAGRPITKEQLARIGSKVLPKTGLPVRAFTGWLDTQEGDDYFRELNGLLRLGCYERYLVEQGRNKEAEQSVAMREAFMRTKKGNK